MAKNDAQVALLAQAMGSDNYSIRFRSGSRSSFKVEDCEKGLKVGRGNTGVKMFQNCKKKKP